MMLASALALIIFGCAEIYPLDPQSHGGGDLSGPQQQTIKPPAASVAII
jgi:hypothetical protein